LRDIGNWAMNWNWVFVVIAYVLLLVVVIYSLRFVYGYRLANRKIEVVLFHVLPVYWVRIEDIETIRKASWSELGVFDTILRMGNRLFGECVLIQKRKGVFRRVVITPHNADGFISQVLALRSKSAHGN
jgi:hypothetical protein